MLIGAPVARSISSLGGNFAAMPIEVLAQPPMQRGELAAFDLARNLRMGPHRRGVDLRTEDVADGVAVELAADEVAVPVHVLQTAVAIVGRYDAEIGLHGGAPSLGQIFHAQSAFEQLELEVEAQHDVQIVGDLIGIGADQ